MVLAPYDDDFELNNGGSRVDKDHLILHVFCENLES